jgi:hypothetical protein
VGKGKFFQRYVRTCSIDGEGIEELLNEILNLGRRIINNHN